jgi:hypothetical protein
MQTHSTAGDSTVRCTCRDHNRHRFVTRGELPGVRHTRWRAGGACLVTLSLLATSCSGGSPATAPVDDGPSLVEVPSVIGDTIEFASGRLVAIGSLVMVEPVDGLMGDPNIVVEQLPLPGSLVVVG